MAKRTRWLLVISVMLLIGALMWRMETSTRPHPASVPDTRVTPSLPGGEVKGAAPVAGVVPAQGLGREGEVSEPPATEGAGAQEEGKTANGLPTVSDILAEPDDDYVRVAKKLAAITVNPRVAMAEREEALAHTLNLSAGNEAEVLTPLIKDPNLPDDLAETILSEALNRPLGYQADLYLVALAERKSPEMQTKIREHLAFLIGGEDKGPDPADWSAAIKAAKAEWPQ